MLKVATDTCFMYLDLQMWCFLMKDSALPLVEITLLVSAAIQSLPSSNLPVTSHSIFSVYIAPYITRQESSQCCLWILYLMFLSQLELVLIRYHDRPRGYKTWVQSQTQNKAQWLVAFGHVSASSQSLRFILSLRMNSSFITAMPGVSPGLM